MILKKLTLRSFRNYSALDLELSPGLNLFFGDNAQGKTNLLEAAFFLASLRSFRGTKAAAMVAWEAKEALVRGEVLGGSPGGATNNSPLPPSRGRLGGGAPGRTRTLNVALAKAGRRVMLDGKKPGSAADYMLALKVSCFSPEDLFLVREYPSCRRRFLDRSVFHLQPGYMDLANRCRGAVKQLNAAIKAGDKKVITAWEEVFAPLAADVTYRRRARVSELLPGAAELYAKVLGGGELGLTYKTAARGDDRAGLEDSYRALLEKKRPEGMRRGFCLAGPHTDDLLVTLSGREMRATASRGQSRLALLALVLADAGLYKEQRGEYPVLLMDDAASELDGKRRDALIEYVSGLGQVLMSSTDKGLLKGKGRSFQVTADKDGWAKAN